MNDIENDDIIVKETALHGNKFMRKVSDTVIPNTKLKIKEWKLNLLTFTKVTLKGILQAILCAVLFHKYNHFVNKYVCMYIYIYL